MVKISIVEDVKHIREGLSYLIATSKDLRVIGSYERAEDLINDIKINTPEVILMDIQLPGINGIDATRIIKQKYPKIEVMMLTIIEDEEKIFDSIKAGANGYILKDTPKSNLIEEILELYNGGSPITPRIARKMLLELKPVVSDKKEYYLSGREKEILKFIVEGGTYQSIAEEINISPNTVRKHIQNIYQKLQVSSKAEVVGKAINEDLI
ncbi:MAG: response regulator transcription factor [Spirochaetota bacterium]|nr:response regulator transcription factor [Spirochaetota bacterium]